MRAGVETLTIMSEDGLLANAEKIGAQLRDGITAGSAASTVSSRSAARA